MTETNEKEITKVFDKNILSVATSDGFVSLKNIKEAFEEALSLADEKYKESIGISEWKIKSLEEEIQSLKAELLVFKSMMKKKRRCSL